MYYGVAPNIFQPIFQKIILFQDLLRYLFHALLLKCEILDTHLLISMLFLLFPYVQIGV